MVLLPEGGAGCGAVRQGSAELAEVGVTGRPVREDDGVSECVGGGAWASAGLGCVHGGQKLGCAGRVCRGPSVCVTHWGARDCWSARWGFFLRGGIPACASALSYVLHTDVITVPISSSAKSLLCGR